MMTPSGDLGLHDAELISVAVERINGTARLEFRLEIGKRRSVELSGLKAFRSEDLALQNVVSRVLCGSRRQLTRDDLEYWVTWVTSLSDAPSWLSDQRKLEWLNACEMGVLELIVFEPSIGAQIAAVCEHFTVS